MTPLVATEFTTGTARAFSRLLVISGYRAFHLAFGDGNRCYSGWEKFAADLEDPLRGLVDLFLLLRPVEPARAERILGEEIYQALLSEEILRETPSGVRTPGLILISFKGLTFFHEYTQRPGIYFGNDSIGLGVYQSPAYGGRTLDLCSGTSIQAMISAQHSAESYAVEINPRAARIAAINLRMNALQDKVRLINASLEEYGRTTTETFDLVTFNPPLLPVPDVLDYPFVGDGGGDGLDVTRLTLQLYLPHIAPGGGIEFIGCGLGRDRQPLFVDELGAILAEHGAHGVVHLLTRYNMQRGDTFYDGLIETAAINSKISTNLSDAVFDLHFQKLGMTELYTFFMRGERPLEKSGKQSGVAIVDLGDGGNCWFH